jgi:hypothetical protein
VNVQMAWEWNWPHWVGGDAAWPMEISFDRMKAGEDHGPGWFVCFQIGRLALLDFGHYNIHHADAGEAEPRVEAQPES